MRFVLFYHSLVSDWNHGNAHFLRGVVRELQNAGHDVVVYEPAEGWSRKNLLADAGPSALTAYAAAFPGLTSVTYDEDELDLDRALEGADVVIVHEWNTPSLIARIGRHRAGSTGYVLLFHDTHHRSVTAPDEIAAFALDPFDGVLAFGEVIRRRYVAMGWSSRAFTWHEAADTALFHPRTDVDKTGDVVWIGNWGDDERSAELLQFLVEPVTAERLRTTMYGVRYPQDAIDLLQDRGIALGGWLANHRVPEVFARHKVTIHVPRRPYVTALPGIPTIRVFEALACGIPLVSAPWDDVESLFRPGLDFLFAADEQHMRTQLRHLVEDPEFAASVAQSGLETIQARHTCRHRVSELLRIVAKIQGVSTERPRINHTEVVV